MSYLKFYREARGPARRVAVFPGSFNPPTCAHLALAERAAEVMDEVIFVLPEAFPHKSFEGVGFAERLELLLKAAQHPRFTVASTPRGLFIEIARALRPHRAEASLHFLCGRDAAERIVKWDYGEPDAFAGMLQEFQLLVAARGGAYEPPPELAHGIAALDLERDYAEVSATEVRRRVLLDDECLDLLPRAIVEDVRRLYRA